MKRGSAERAVAESNLPMAETLTMMMLLRRADNDTCIVPDWRTPTMPELAAEVRVGVRWLQMILKHLERHGWVQVDPGRGRGHKSSYALIPGADPGRCDCRKRRTAVRGPSRKKVNPTSPFTQRKGEVGQQEKAKSNGATLQASNGFAPRAPRGNVNKGELADCIGGCGKPARRACRTCWEHASLELLTPAAAGR